MNTYPGQQRSDIRVQCRDLRKRILSKRPANMLSLLLEVGDVECCALAAGPNELSPIKMNLVKLADKVRGAGNQ